MMFTMQGRSEGFAIISIHGFVPQMGRHSMSSFFSFRKKGVKKTLKTKDYKAIAHVTFFALRF